MSYKAAFAFAISGAAMVFFVYLFFVCADFRV